MLGMLALASHELERLADFHLGTHAIYEHRILLVEYLENRGTNHPLAFFFLRWHLEAIGEHRLQVVCLEERLVLLLDASHLVIGEPVGG